MKKKVIAQLYNKIVAIKNCKQTGNVFWEDEHEKTLCQIVDNHLPSGSGFNSGCMIVLSECKNDKIVITFDYHHMSENGYYTRRTHHKAVITPSFDGFYMNITKDGIRDYTIMDYFYQAFDTCLNNEVEVM